MEGKIQHIEDDIYLYTCTKLPAPWTSDEYPFYAVGKQVWIAGPIARAMCNAGSNSNKCDIRGVTVDGLARNVKWFSLFDHLPKLWAFFNPTEPVPDCALMEQQILDAIESVPRTVSPELIAVNNQHADAMMAHCQAMEEHFAPLNNPELQQQVRSIREAVAAKTQSIPQAMAQFNELLVKYPISVDQSLSKEFLQSLLDRVHSLANVPRLLEEIKPRLQVMLKAELEFQLNLEQEASRKRMRNQEDESAWLLLKEEEEFRKRLQGYGQKAETLQNRMDIKRGF